MLPLSGSSFPSSNESLQQSLAEGLGRLGVAPREVLAEGADFPRLDRLQIDLTGAAVHQAPPKLKAVVRQGGKLQAESLLLVAAPLLAAGSPVQLRLEARGAELQEFSAEPEGRVLVLEGAAQGKFALEMKQADLERLVHFVAREAAKQRGGDVTELRLQLRSAGGRELELEGDVVAKFGFLKATLHLTGRAALDDALQLHLSDLQVKGTGMASNVAIGFIRPQLEKLQQQPIALGSASLNGLRLRDARVTTGETVRLEAEFGGAA